MPPLPGHPFGALMDTDPQYVPYIIGGLILGLVIGIVVILCIVYAKCGGFDNCCKKEEQTVSNVPVTKHLKYAAPKRPSLVIREAATQVGPAAAPSFWAT